MLYNTINSSLETLGDDKIKKTRKVKGKEKQVNTTKICEFLDFGTKIMPGRVEITLPIRTVSEANNFDPWVKKHKRHKAQKTCVFFSMINLKQNIKLPCKITFIRYAPKNLDAHDNLPMSLKWICDTTCAQITNEHRPGLADNFKDININYDQVISKTYAVKIIITF